MTAQDFLKGIDPTGFASITNADLIQLIDNAVPFSDTSTTGKGMTLWTKDTALDTPQVPDPTVSASFTKWIRYIWLRIPWVSATDPTPLIYVWNAAAPNDPTYLKWVLVSADLTDLEAQIAAVSIVANNALATANAANAAATAAASVANNALAIANAAQDDATTAINGNAINALAIAALQAALAALTGSTTTGLAAVTMAATAATTATLAAQGVALPHGLSAVPKTIRGALVCFTAELGFAVNDEIDLAYVNNWDAPYNGIFMLAADITNIYISHPLIANFYGVFAKAGNLVGLTPGNWKFKAYYSLN